MQPIVVEEGHGSDEPHKSDGQQGVTEQVGLETPGSSTTTNGIIPHTEIASPAEIDSFHADEAIGPIPTPTTTSNAKVDIVTNARKSLRRPTALPGNLANPQKRSAPTSWREDTYDVPKDVNGDGRILARDILAPPAPKRQRKEAKQPISFTKTSNASVLSSPNGITHKSAREHGSNGISSSGGPSAAGPRHTPLKRMANHLRTNAVQNSAQLNDHTTNVQTREHEQDSFLYMNPSPIKPPHAPANSTKAPVVHRLSDGSGEVSNNADGNEPEESSDPEAESEPAPPAALQSGRKSKTRSRADAGFQIDYDALEEMLELVGRIGYSYNGQEERWKLKKVDDTNIITVEGKRLKRRLRGLTTAYMNLQKTGGNISLIEDAEVEIEKWSVALQDETHRILTRRLGNPTKNIPYFDINLTRAMLEELYHKLIPSMVQLVKTAIVTRDKHDACIKTMHLKQLTELLGSLYMLSATALNQPTESQPVSLFYQLKQPVRSLLPIVRQLQKDINSVVRAREVQRDRIEREEIEAEREREQEEEEEMAEIENRRRIKEVHRKQRLALRKKFDDPLWGRLMRAGIARERAKEAAKSEDRRYSQAPSSRSRRGASVDDDPFADVDFERVHVFGKNNVSKEGKRKAWSDSERTEFIDIMRLERGKIS